jgi:acetyl esterase/lipase
MRVYRPRATSNALPCLFWIHGGGFILGSIEQDDPVIERIVDAVGCVVISVDWRRAPKHPFPAAADDCYAGLKWTFENTDVLAIDPERLAVGGASSGGGSALRLQSWQEIEVRFLLPINS